MDLIVSQGGGLSSTIAMPILCQEYYPEYNQVHVMAVLKNEHPDTWKLVEHAERLTGIPTTLITFDPDSPSKYRILNGLDEINTAMNAWDIFEHAKFLGNSRIDPCSRELKRNTIKRWLKSTYPNTDTTYLAVGITADEIDRTLAILRHWNSEGYRNTIFPLVDHPIDDLQAWVMERTNGFIPELYTKGFRHNNCGGACIKAGKKQWLQLWDEFPDVYLTWEHAEKEFNMNRGFDYDNVANPKYTYLRERVAGNTQNISLQVLRQRGFKALSPEELADTNACWFCVDV